MEVNVFTDFVSKKFPPECILVVLQTEKDEQRRHRKVKRENEQINKKCRVDLASKSKSALKPKFRSKVLDTLSG